MSNNASDGFGRPRDGARWTLTPGAAPAQDVRVGPEGSGADLLVKKGARIDNLTAAIRGTFPKIVAAWRGSGGPTPVITSGNDSKHRKGSRHYENSAIDLRCNNLSDAHCQRITDALQKGLGPDFDVIFERFPNNPQNDHVHLEHDPKRPRRA
jgi:conjugal transfer mating pair stabilization protein TraG